MEIVTDTIAVVHSVSLLGTTPRDPHPLHSLTAPGDLVAHLFDGQNTKQIEQPFRPAGGEQARPSTAG